MTNLYRIVGTDRKSGAIGVFSRFTMFVEGDDAQDAAWRCIEQRHADGREHVLPVVCELAQAGGDGHD